MHVGATIRLLRVERGLALRDLARRIGVSSAYLSRVENSVDAPPTPERLEAIAEELGVPVALLLDISHRLSPLVLRYAEEEPQAASLFLDIARLRLRPDDLAAVQRYVRQRFESRPMAEPVEIAPYLHSSRVVLDLECGGLEEALQIAAARFARPDGCVPASLARAMCEREETASSSIGEGIAVPHACVASIEPQAVLVTLARPIRMRSPDRAPVSVLLVLVEPKISSKHVARIAHIARLAARGLSAELASARDPRSAIERVARLERIG